MSGGGINSLIAEQALLSLVQDGGEGTSSSSSSSWLSSQGWSRDSGVSVCSWTGVSCDNTESSSGDGDHDGSIIVTEINLPNFKVSGTLPSELGLLADLQVITLSNNMLSGSIPQEVANLKKLVTLDLSDCYLTGALPQRFESTNLSSLLLANNAISGKFFHTPHSPHLQSINEIRLENNLLTGTLHGPILTAMTNLKALSLSVNDLSGLIPGAELGSIPTLQYLYLDSNHFVGPLPSQLAQDNNGASLLELWVQDNALSGTVPASFDRFDDLHDFFIDRNKLTGLVPPDLCGPQINSDFFINAPPEATRNYCDSIACPAGSVAAEGVYPCTECPGGEGARLKNKYLGAVGECTDYMQRDALEIFHKATTKGGAWKGVSDWDDPNKGTCEMTGITCDLHGNVVEISLKNRGLAGHIPEEIGFLTFLERMDVSDNALMGYLPSDLRWTSITSLDISGNMIRGIVPPLLCSTEGLNGEDHSYYCDRIACPRGTYNSLGFHRSSDVEPCQPCYDESPFIGRKECTLKHPSSKFNWIESVQIAKDISEGMGVSPKIGAEIVLGIILITISLCWLMKDAMCCLQKKYDRGTLVAHGSTTRNNYDVEKDYDFNVEGNNLAHRSTQYRDVEHRNRGYQDTDYRDFIITDENDEEVEPSDDNDDDTTSRSTSRSATDLMSDHQGMTLSTPEKIKKAVSRRLSSGELATRARSAASSINVSARHARRKIVERNSLLTPGQYADAEDSINGEDFGDGMELVGRLPRGLTASEKDGSMSKELQPSDLLDVPMIT